MCVYIYVYVYICIYTYVYTHNPRWQGGKDSFSTGLDSRTKWPHISFFVTDTAVNIDLICLDRVVQKTITDTSYKREYFKWHQAPDEMYVFRGSRLRARIQGKGSGKKARCTKLLSQDIQLKRALLHHNSQKSTQEEWATQHHAPPRKNKVYCRLNANLAALGGNKLPGTQIKSFMQRGTQQGRGLNLGLGRLLLGFAVSLKSFISFSCSCFRRDTTRSSKRQQGSQPRSRTRLQRDQVYQSEPQECDS